MMFPRRSRSQLKQGRKFTAIMISDRCCHHWSCSASPPAAPVGAAPPALQQLPPLVRVQTSNKPFAVSFNFSWNRAKLNSVHVCVDQLHIEVKNLSRSCQLLRKLSAAQLWPAGTAQGPLHATPAAPSACLNTVAAISGWLLRPSASLARDRRPARAAASSGSPRAKADPRAGGGRGRDRGRPKKGSRDLSLEDSAPPSGSDAAAPFRSAQGVHAAPPRNTRSGLDAS